MAAKSEAETKKKKMVKKTMLAKKTEKFQCAAIGTHVWCDLAQAARVERVASGHGVRCLQALARSDRKQ